MTAEEKTLALCGAVATAAFIALSFLLPRGESVSFELLRLGALLGLFKLCSMLYARAQRSEPLWDDRVAAETEWHVAGAAVPPELLESGAPLIGLYSAGQLPHPEFANFLAPYFKDQSLGFVQAGTRFLGEGPAAHTLRALAEAKRTHGEGRGALRAVPLVGGALISREALRAAWRPGISWGELGVRMQAMGYSARFESEELVLERAPETLEGYCFLMLRRTREALVLAPAAAIVRGLPFSARMQYIGDAAGYCAMILIGAALALSPFVFVLRGAGPIIIGHSFWPLYATFAILLFATARLMARATEGALSMRVMAYAVAALPLWGAARLGAYVRMAALKAFDRMKSRKGPSSTPPAVPV